MVLHGISDGLHFTYDNKNKILREIGLISLAIATSIKIHPVVFGLMLLFDKRWAEAKRCIIYGVLIFFVPFLCFGGFSEFTVLLSNLTNASNFLGSIGHGYRLNFSNTVYGVFDVLQRTRDRGSTNCYNMHSMHSMCSICLVSF